MLDKLPLFSKAIDAMLCCVLDTELDKGITRTSLLQLHVCSF